MWSCLHLRLGDPPYVISPTWDPPPSRKQALRKGQKRLLIISKRLTRAKQTFMRSGCITVFHQIWKFQFTYSKELLHLTLFHTGKNNRTKTVVVTWKFTYWFSSMKICIQSLNIFVRTRIINITSEDTLKRIMSPLAHAIQWKQTWKSQPVLTCEDLHQQGIMGCKLCIGHRKHSGVAYMRSWFLFCRRVLTILWGHRELLFKKLLKCLI